MAIDPLEFNPVNAYEDTEQIPTDWSNETLVRQYLNKFIEQIRDYINNSLIPSHLCRMHQTNAQNINSAQLTLITPDTTDFDTDSMIYNGFIYCRKAGIYHVNVGADISASSYNIYLYKNGAPLMTNSGISGFQTLSKLEKLEVGDYLGLYVYQGTGSIKSTQGNNQLHNFAEAYKID